MKRTKDGYVFETNGWKLRLNRVEGGWQFRLGRKTGPVRRTKREAEADLDWFLDMEEFRKA